MKQRDLDLVDLASAMVRRAFRGHPRFVDIQSDFERATMHLLNHTHRFLMTYVQDYQEPLMLKHALLAIETILPSYVTQGDRAMLPIDVDMAGEDILGVYEATRRKLARWYTSLVPEPIQKVLFVNLFSYLQILKEVLGDHTNAKALLTTALEAQQTFAPLQSMDGVLQKTAPLHARKIFMNSVLNAGSNSNG